MSIRVHETAAVAASAVIGDGTVVWHQAQVMDGARLGEGCVVSKGVFIDRNVSVGNRCKIQNYASLYHDLTLEDGVFVGPYVCFTNDRLPRAINPDGTLKSAADWDSGATLVRYGASIGAGTILITGVTVGRWAMVGAGSLVVHDVPDFGLVVGHPARLRGFACPCGGRLEPRDAGSDVTQCVCVRCGATQTLSTIALDELRAR